MFSVLFMNISYEHYHFNILLMNQSFPVELKSYHILSTVKFDQDNNLELIKGIKQQN